MGGGAQNSDAVSNEFQGRPAEPKYIEIGIFAHNEEDNIREVLQDLAKQTLLSVEGLSIRITILANGCSDGTVEVARSQVQRLFSDQTQRISVLELPLPGKSRTWNSFVHEISGAEVDIYVMMDGDIRIPEPETLRLLIGELSSRRELRVFTSRPVKDLELVSGKKGLSERTIVAGSGGLTDWRKALCGQLYAIRGEIAQNIWLPIGLPVEDGFVRAMALTDFLTDLHEEDNRIDGNPSVWHVYSSIRTIPELVRHQTRIVVGSAINSALYARIRRLAPTPEAAQALLRDASRDDEWLARVLREDLPRAPFGYVPFHFLVKRFKRADAGLLRRPQRLVAFVGGLGLDVVAYVLATVRMMSGRAAGHW